MVNKTKKYGGRNPFNLIRSTGRQLSSTGRQLSRRITSGLSSNSKGSRPNKNFMLKTNVEVFNRPSPLQSVIQVFPLGNYNFTKSGHKLTLKIVPYKPHIELSKMDECNKTKIKQILKNTLHKNWFMNKGNLLLEEQSKQNSTLSLKEELKRINGISVDNHLTNLELMEQIKHSGNNVNKQIVENFTTNPGFNKCFYLLGNGKTIRIPIIPFSRLYFALLSVIDLVNKENEKYKYNTGTCKGFILKFATDYSIEVSIPKSSIKPLQATGKHAENIAKLNLSEYSFKLIVVGIKLGNTNSSNASYDLRCTINGIDYEIDYGDMIPSIVAEPVEVEVNENEERPAESGRDLEEALNFSEHLEDPLGVSNKVPNYTIVGRQTQHSKTTVGKQTQSSKNTKNKKALFANNSNRIKYLNELKKNGIEV